MTAEQPPGCPGGILTALVICLFYNYYNTLSRFVNRESGIFYMGRARTSFSRVAAGFSRVAVGSSRVAAGSSRVAAWWWSPEPDPWADTFRVLSFFAVSLKMPADKTNNFQFEAVSYCRYFFDFWFCICMYALLITWNGVWIASNFKLYNKVDAHLFSRPAVSNQILQHLFSFAEYSLPAIFSLQLLFLNHQKYPYHSSSASASLPGAKAAI